MRSTLLFYLGLAINSITLLVTVSSMFNMLAPAQNLNGSNGSSTLVRADDFDTPKYEISEIRIVCTGCGFNKTLENISKRHDPKQKRGNILIFGSPVDPFFTCLYGCRLIFPAKFYGRIIWNTLIF